jgi:hypothetical protein
MVGFDSGDCYKSTFVAGGDGNFHVRFEYLMNEAVKKSYCFVGSNVDCLISSGFPLDARFAGALSARCRSSPFKLFAEQRRLSGNDKWKESQVCMQCTQIIVL